MSKKIKISIFFATIVLSLIFYWFVNSDLLLQISCNINNYQKCTQLAQNQVKKNSLNRQKLIEIQNNMKEILQKACRFDEAEACALLADWLIEDIGRTKNNHLIEILELSQKACDLGSIFGCANLLLKIWYLVNRACKYNNDDLESCSKEITDFLAVHNLTDEKIDFYFEKMCFNFEISYCNSSNYIGLRSEEENIDKALFYFKLKCDSDFKNDCDTLANIYREGKYVKKNIIKSRKYLKRYCSKELNEDKKDCKT